MCRGKVLQTGETGTAGRRCGCDTSEARRQRRKAATVEKKYARQFTVQTPAQTTHVTTSTTVFFTFEEAILEAEKLRTLYQQPTPEGYTDEQWDAELEKLSTAVGAAVAIEAERIAGFDFQTHEIKLAEYDERLIALARELNSHPEYSEWLQAHQHNASEIEAIHAQQMGEELTTKAIQLEELKKERAETVTSATAILSEAYRETLAKIRPLGGELIADYDEPINADFIEEEVSPFYPETWLEYSNNKGNFQVIEEADRPSYQSGQVANVSHFATTNKNHPLIQRLQQSPGFNQVTKDEQLDDTLSSITQGEPVQGYTIQRRTEFNPEKDTMGADGKPLPHPDGKEWHYGYPFTSLNDINRTLTGEKVWYRLQPAEGESILYFTPFDTEVPGTVSPYRNATAIHELGHRMEDVIPNRALVRAEEAFLKRRTTNSATGEREKMSHMTYLDSNLSNSILDNEIGYKDNFIHHYVGRVYLTEDAHEVFTTGMEALFGHEWGGLISLDGKKDQQDKDHRAFTLGALASI